MSDPAPLPGGAGATGADLDELYRRHWNEIRSFVARSFGAGPPDPEDAAQAAFAQFAAIADRSAIENPRAFLFRSARNHVLDFRRRQQTQRRYADELGENLASAPAPGDQHRVLEGKERLAAVMAAVRDLEPRRRRVLIWHTIHELSFNDIAVRLGVSKVRVRQLFAEALMMCEQATQALDAEDGR